MSKMVELDMGIAQRNVMAIWKILAQGFDSLDDGGSGSVFMAPSTSMNVDPTMLAASTLLVQIPRMISELSK